MAKTRANPYDLGLRGLRLFKSISVEKTLSEVETVLLVEACRAADRLEHLNDLISGDEDTWLRLKFPRSDEGVIEVLVADPIKEARMQAAALRTLLDRFEVKKAGEGEAKPVEVPSNVASLQEKVKARQGRSASRS